VKNGEQLKKIRLDSFPKSLIKLGREPIRTWGFVVFYLEIAFYTSSSE
jgi:hypothetical protein